MFIVTNKGGGNLFFFPVETAKELYLPYINYGINAGFPSPAQDFLELSIDLNRELIRNPSTTFFARVRGDSMQDAGISDGDLLIIDKSLKPTDGKIAICCIDGEFTVKRIKIERNCCWLMPANPAFKPIYVSEDNNLLIWGIVIHVIKHV